MKTLSPTARHVIAPGNFDVFGAGIIATISCGRARDFVLAPAHDQHRHAASRQASSGENSCRRPLMQAASAFEVRLRPLGEDAERTRDRVADRRSARRFERRDDMVAPARPGDDRGADAAEDRRANSHRMREREQHADAPAHRVAEIIGALELEMVEQRERVARHDRQAIGGGIVGFDEWPWPRLSSAITRRPAFRSVETQSGEPS